MNRSLAAFVSLALAYSTVMADDAPTSVPPKSLRVAAIQMHSTGSHGQSRIIAPDGNILHEATVFRDEAVTATLDLSKSTGKFAQRSAAAGPLSDWWRDGAKRVRMID